MASYPEAPTLPGQPNEAEYLVTLPRAALFEFFGRMALPPWTDVDGIELGGRIKCAPIAEEITRWVREHEVIPE